MTLCYPDWASLVAQTVKRLPGMQETGVRSLGWEDPLEKSEVAQSCPSLCNPMDSSLHQAPASMGFSRQEYWSGLPFPSPGNLPEPGIKPRSLSLQVDSLPSESLDLVSISSSY